jgi:hypothetical protein
MRSLQRAGREPQPLAGVLGTPIDGGVPDRQVVDGSVLVGCPGVVRELQYAIKEFRRRRAESLSFLLGDAAGARDGVD